MADCNHDDLHFHLGHHHFGDTNVHQLDISAKCNKCGIRMRFIGFPPGVSFTHPTADLDGLEARIPMVPENEVPDTEITASFVKPPRFDEPLQ